MLGHNRSVYGILFVLFALLSFAYCERKNSLDVNEIHYWIQNHDYSSVEFNNVTLKGTIEAYQNFDWQKELSLYEEGSGDKDCYPGIGIHTGYNYSLQKGVLLHIYHSNLTTVDFFFNYFSPKNDQNGKMDKEFHEYEVINYPENKVPDLIKLFFEARYDEILSINDGPI